MNFEINNDLNRPVWDKHNKSHVVIVAVITASYFLPWIFGKWWFGISLMTLWEIGDGFKPWWQEFKPTGHKFRDWFVENFLYSNKFSLQDFVIWNIAGFGWGILIRQAIQVTIC